MKIDLKYAAQVLSKGGIVVYPTETVYGVGVDAYSENAIKKLFKIKGRDIKKPMSISVSSIEMINEVAYIDEFSESFINHFLPGPITVILPGKEVLSEYLIAENGTIGIRMPNHQIAISLISLFGRPITSTSANISGKNAPTRPDEIEILCDYFLDGGILPGVPSTIVDLNNRNILREGTMCKEVNYFLKSK